MKKELWKENYNKEVVRHLYFKPLLSSLITFFSVILLTKFLLNDILSAPLILLAGIVYYIYYMDAKIDLLKRTMDEKSKFKSNKYLWLEKEYNSEKPSI